MKSGSNSRRGEAGHRAHAGRLGVAVAVGWIIAGGLLTVSASGQPPVGLGTAASFAVLAGTTVTNTGPSTIAGSVGVYPGTAITGFPPGQVTSGSIHSADGVAQQAQADLTTAYLDAAARTPAAPVTSDLGGQRLIPGVYKATSGMGLTGTVTLNGQGDPNAVFIFQAGSTLTTAAGSSVALTGGAQACDVFWVVGSSATLGTNSSFAGTVLALTSISVQTGATVAGRVLARNGEVSLDDNTFTQAACSSASPSPSPSASQSPSPSASTGGTPTAATPNTGALAGSNAGEALGLGAIGVFLFAAGLAWASVSRSRIEIAGRPRRHRWHR